MQVISLDTVHKGWARFMVATLKQADGRTLRREIEDHGSAVCVLPYDPQRRTAILVRQFRAPAFVAGQQMSLLEAIAGILETEDPVACVRREAMEEAGLRLPSLERVAMVWTMPGISTERMHLFLAPFTVADRVAAGGGHAGEGEEIEVVEMPLDRLARAAEAGEISDMKTLLLVQTLRLRRADLFRPEPSAPRSRR